MLVKVGPDVNFCHSSYPCSWYSTVNDWHFCFYKIKLYAYCMTVPRERPLLLPQVPVGVPSNTTWNNSLREINTLRPGKNGRHFPDDHLKCIFLNENIWISINISLKFVPKGRINNIPALVKIMAWCQATSHYLNQWWLDCWRIYASFGLDELINYIKLRCFFID